jgi:hypothetical protein
MAEHIAFTGTSGITCITMKSGRPLIGTIERATSGIVRSQSRATADYSQHSAGIPMTIAPRVGAANISMTSEAQTSLSSDPFTVEVHAVASW